MVRKGFKMTTFWVPSQRGFTGSFGYPPDQKCTHLCFETRFSGHQLRAFTGSFGYPPDLKLVKNCIKIMWFISHDFRFRLRIRGAPDQNTNWKKTVLGVYNLVSRAKTAIMLSLFWVSGVSWSAVLVRCPPTPKNPWFWGGPLFFFQVLKFQRIFFVLNVRSNFKWPQD